MPLHVGDPCRCGAKFVIDQHNTRTSPNQSIRMPFDERSVKYGALPTVAVGGCFVPHPYFLTPAGCGHYGELP